MTVSRSRNLTAMVAAGLLIAACGGGGGGSSVPPGAGGASGAGGSGGGAPPVDPVSKIDTNDEAYRFLARATFGGTKSEIASLTGRDAADWLSSEFSKSASLTTPALLALPRNSDGDIPNRRINTL